MNSNQRKKSEQTKSTHRFKDLDARKNPKGGGGNTQVQSGTAASKPTTVAGIPLGDGG